MQAIDKRINAKMSFQILNTEYLKHLYFIGLPINSVIAQADYKITWTNLDTGETEVLRDDSQV